MEFQSGAFLHFWFVSAGPFDAFVAFVALRASVAHKAKNPPDDVEHSSERSFSVVQTLEISRVLLGYPQRVLVC